MKKIAFISEGCYVHIDFQLIPALSDSFVIGWFPFFNSATSDSTVADFTEQSKNIPAAEFSHIRLSCRMRSLSTRKELQSLLRTVRNFAPDVVYINADGFPWLPLLARKLFLHIPVVAAIHDVAAHSRSSLITRLYKPLLPHFYSHLNTYSDYCYRLLQAKNYRNKTISCCRHPLTDFGKLEEKKHDAFTALFFGNLLAYKGLPLLLAAGERAYEQNPHLRIKIVGRGADEQLLEPYKNHPAFTIINRRVEDSEIPAVFSDVDCLVLPYTDATQSGPMMIALNYAIPVLATDIPAFAWYGEHFSEVHLLKNDVSVWADAFVKRAAEFPHSFPNSEKYRAETEAEKQRILAEWKTLFEWTGEKE